MKKQILSTLVLLTCLIFPFSLHSQEQQRKKVGVVLSGGGAKGMAHIKALKVIEEAGIPIDYIAVGTSFRNVFLAAKVRRPSPALTRTAIDLYIIYKV